ncbi:MAG: hypothetical protein IJJ65_07430 [Butyrivibrio sp.]|nr:hypothetical protein [Butyrivibrio sp.]
MGIQLYVNYVGIWGLIPFYVAWVIPYSTFMIKGFVENIPKELDEATYMDGGSILAVFISCQRFFVQGLTAGSVKG